MAAKIAFDLVSPEKLLLSAQADMEVVGPSAEGAFPLPHPLRFRIAVIGNAIEVHLDPSGSTIWARCPPGEQPFLEYEPPA